MASCNGSRECFDIGLLAPIGERELGQSGLPTILMALWWY
jgi:hypothetical protein